MNRTKASNYQVLYLYPYFDEDTLLSMFHLFQLLFLRMLIPVKLKKMNLFAAHFSHKIKRQCILETFTIICTFFEKKVIISKE